MTTSTTCTTTTSSITTVAKTHSGSILASTPTQADNKTGHLFNSFREGVSGIITFSKRMSGKALAKVKPTHSKEHSWTLPYPKDTITHLFAFITTPTDFVACSLTCKSWYAASKSISISTCAGIFARESSPSSISIESYKKKISELTILFPELSVMQIETVLRQAIKFEHKNTFFVLALCLANSTSSFAHTDQHKKEFEQVKLILEKSLNETTEAFNAAKINLQEQFVIEFHGLTFVNNIDDLAVLNFRGLIKIAQEAYHLKEREYHFALNGTSRLAAFYSELNENITKDNMQERYSEMNKIIK